MRNGTESNGRAPDVVPALSEDLPLVETDLLIVGAGPAGASLACFLASHGGFREQLPCLIVAQLAFESDL